MSVFDWINKLVNIPGRLTSIAVEKVVCGADEVWDDTLDKRQSELNAQFKAVCDQEQIAINGGTAEIASSAEDIEAGSGAIVTANAVAGIMQGVMKGESVTISVSGDVVVNGSVSAGQQKSIMYVNDSASEITVTVPASLYRTPDGESISFVIPAGGYGEVSLLNVGGTIFARGG